MRIENLIPMEDFVLQLRAKTTGELLKDIPNVFWDISKMVTKSAGEIANFIVANDAILWRIAGNYAKFLKQTPELWMFIPVDADGNPMKFNSETGHNAYDREYIQAKQKCLFEGFEVVEITDNFISLYYPLHPFTLLFDLSDSTIWDGKKLIDTISNLTKYNLPLSQSALDKIYN